MGLISRLFGRGKKPDEAGRAQAEGEDAPAAAIAPELATALAALQRPDFETAFALAREHVEAAAPDTRADAHRLCALALSELDRYPQAFDHWHALFDLEPSAHNALQLATVSAMCDEVERGEAWLMHFDQINADTREMSPVSARTNFISALNRAGHGQAALAHLEWLRDVYEQVRVTDSTYLYMRGIPFLSAFFDNSLPMLQAQLSPSQVRHWYSALDGKLDEDGQAQLQAWIAGLPAD
ncbi:hypothetical protein [Lysobacter sp. CA199]|uniref:hypothetical protein n=1 Tax=Lysobacter sp. CA199 TaxID=3455608 RepID=UPI003F8D0506